MRATPPALLATRDFGFQDPRLAELLFRYRARNWPETLTADERDRWNAYRRLRLDVDSGWSESTFAQFHAEIAALRIARTDDGAAHLLLDQLATWGHAIEASLR